MNKVLGRTDDMIIIRGVNVFPSQIESVLMEIGDTEPHYLLVVDRIGNLDSLEVRVEVSNKLFSDEVRKLEDLRQRITREIQGTLGLTAKVKLVEPKSSNARRGRQNGS